MNAEEFERELARYAVVRPVDYNASESVFYRTDKQEEDATPPVQPPTRAPPAVATVADDVDGSFDSIIQSQLSISLDSTTIESAVNIFRRNYQQSLNSLSLEDIETIAKGL